MPYKTLWYVEKHVIACQFSGETTQEELLTSTDEIAGLIGSAQAPIFLIIDVRNVTKFAYNFHIALQAAKPPASIKLVNAALLLSTSRLYNFFGKMASQFFGVPLRAFPTQEEANAFIAHQAPELTEKLSQQGA